MDDFLMFTPQQVQEKCFSKAFMGGYDMGEVDDFLDPLTEDYSALYKENALLKSKMKVLVEKVEEYRATEESMRQALKSAKEMANDIVQEAQRKSVAAPAAAPGAGAAELDEIRRQVALEQEKLAKLKKEQARYVEGMRRVLEAQKDMLDEYETEVETQARIPFEEKRIETVEPAEKPVEEPVFEPVKADVMDGVDERDTIADIVESVNEIADDADVRHYGSDGNETVAIDFDKDGESAEQIGIFDNDPTIKLPDIDEEAAKQAKKEPKHKFNFTNLQFGKDYEIK